VDRYHKGRANRTKHFAKQTHKGGLSIWERGGGGGGTANVLPERMEDVPLQHKTMWFLHDGAQFY
jgi:hypothetical protein